MDKAGQAKTATTSQEIKADVSEDKLCDICGAKATEIHCKIICLNCGYTRDCSDP